MTAIYSTALPAVMRETGSHLRRIYHKAQRIDCHHNTQQGPGVQAAAHIQARAPRSSPEKYLAEFRESERKRSKLLEHDTGDIRRDGGASNAILTT
jgi:hypothetical protein